MNALLEKYKALTEREFEDYERDCEKEEGTKVRH